MKKLRILLAIENYLPNLNGVAIFTQRLAYSLSERGHRVAVIAPGTKFKDEEIEEDNQIKIYRMKSIPIKPIHPTFRIVYKANIEKKIRKITRDFRPDIIHIQNHFTLGRACVNEAKILNIPIIGTNHFMPENLLEYFPQFIRKKIVSSMWRDFLKVYNQLDYVTTPSYVAKKILMNLGLKNEISVISNGICLQKFRKVQVKDDIYQKFKLNKNLPIFLFVGRLDKDKNIDMVLKAVKLALKKKTFQTVIVGKGKDVKSLKKLSKALNISDKIIFTGEVNDNDLHILLSLADIYIASGSAELQGIAVMEAMASELPVLALNAVALPELVKNGINGFLFEFDEYDLCEKMIKILSLEQKKLSVMSKNSLKIIQLHSQEETLNQFETLYERIISK